MQKAGINLKGIAASDGIGFAKAYKLIKPDLSFEKKQFRTLRQHMKLTG